MNAEQKKSTSRFRSFFRRNKPEEGESEAEKPDANVSKAKKPSRFSMQFNKLRNIRQTIRENEKRERALVTTRIKVITFFVSLVTMMAAFSFIPLFPQPLPLLVAVLVAFIIYQIPRVGMPIGCTIIGLGLLYHLSFLNFIAYIGYVPLRIGFVGALLGVLIIVPVVFCRYRHAIAINLGILAAMALFFNSYYFLAIPLILTAVVFFKKEGTLAAVYYALISSPLLIYSYYQTIITIPQSDFWNYVSPPIFVPVNSVYTQIQSTMPDFRLYTANIVVTQITNQFTTFPGVLGRTLFSAFIQYRDSFPGILMFVAILVGMILALTLLVGAFLKATNFGFVDRISASIVATLATALFFLFLGVLQTPLAYSAKVNGTTTLLATLATLVFTLPISLVNYNPKKNATSDMITEKANSLLGQLQKFEQQLKTVKSSIPVNVGTTDVKMLLIKDKLNDILTKAQNRFYEPSEIDKIFEDLDKKVPLQIDDLVTELNAILREYQIFVNTEYASWVGKLKDEGLEFKGPLKPHYEPDLPLDERIVAIQEVLEAGRVLAVDVIQAVGPIYDITRALYDQSLPKQSQAIGFAKKKLDDQAPFLAVQELYVALNNWRRQYGEEIAKSTEYLKSSLIPIINLSSQSDRLSPVLGDKTPLILGDAKKAQQIKAASEKKPLNVLSLITIQDLLDGVLDLSKDVFTILDKALNDQEKSIEDMLPTSNYLWEKNATLNERMTEALTVLSSPKSKVNDIMENLPKFEGYIDECIQTLTIYNERREFLLNYPMAKLTIEDQLKLKSKLTVSDLPFEQKFAAEYLRVYYLQNFNDYEFDTQNVWLTKKT